MGTDEDCAKSPVLPEGEPPPCSVLSRQSSVPFEVWWTEGQTRSSTTGTHPFPTLSAYLWKSLR